MNKKLHDLQKYESSPLSEEALADARQNAHRYWLADFIFAARMRRQLGQADLAKASKTTQATISALENGDANPTWDTLANILRSLNVLDALKEQAETAEYARSLERVVDTQDRLVNMQNNIIDKLQADLEERTTAIGKLLVDRARMTDALKAERAAVRKEHAVTSDA